MKTVLITGDENAVPAEYLNRIRAKKTGEEVSFSISPSIEKEDIVNINLFQNKVASPLDHFPLQKCLSQNIYQKLDRIESPHDTISFGYTSSSLERLKLLSVSFNSGPVNRYGMKYNTLPLPDYHSRQLDSWGYYSQSTILDGDGPYYQADENAMKAEILESLQYPTGGKTQFEYEAHRYGRIARQYPFELESSSGMVGGLRIKRMKDITDNEEIVREYLYQDGNGESSGILADKPRFEADGTLSLGMSGYHVTPSTIRWQTSRPMPSATGARETTGPCTGTRSRGSPLPPSSRCSRRTGGTIIPSSGTRKGCPAPISTMRPLLRAVAMVSDTGLMPKVFRRAAGVRHWGRRPEIGTSPPCVRPGTMTTAVAPSAT